MNLNIKHITLLLIAILLSACAMENKSNNNIEAATEPVELSDEEISIENVEIFKIEPQLNTPLINQKLQDFYDLIALQNKHPEFTDDVAAQLKNYTNDSITDFTGGKTVVIKDLKQLGNIVIINDNIQKIKLTYNKVFEHTKTADTIFATITYKTIIIDDEQLVSNKIHFSKN